MQSTQSRSPARSEKRHPATPTEVRAGAAPATGPKATGQAPAVNQTRTAAEQWQAFFEKLNNNNQLPDYYRKQAVIALQKKLDPNLEIPLIVMDVSFDGNGRLQSISVVNKADTQGVVDDAKRRENVTKKIANMIDTGELQALARDQRATTKQVKMPWSDLGVWIKSRIGMSAWSRGGPKKFAKKLEKLAQDEMVAMNAKLTSDLLRTLRAVEASLHLHGHTGTRGLFREAAGKSALDARIFAVFSGRADLFADGKDAAILLADLSKTLLRERAGERLTDLKAKQVRGNQKKINKMIAGLPQAEKEVWEVVFRICHAVVKAQAGNGLDARGLARLIAPNLFHITDWASESATELVAELIEHYGQYFEEKPKVAHQVRRPKPPRGSDETWTRMLTALSDVRGGLDLLGIDYKMKFTNDNPPLRNVFQKGAIPKDTDVPSQRIEKRFNEKNTFGLFVDVADALPENVERHVLNVIEATLLRVVDELAKKMKGKLTDAQLVELFNALGGNDVIAETAEIKKKKEDERAKNPQSTKQFRMTEVGKVEPLTTEQVKAAKILLQQLPKRELQDLRKLFHALSEISEAIVKHSSNRNMITKPGLAANFYNLVSALTGTNSDERRTLEDIWSTKFKTHYGEVVKRVALHLILDGERIFAD